MDALYQLGYSLGLVFGAALILGIVVWPIVWTWLVIRAFRDLHDIRESLHWIAHCTQAPERSVDTPRRPVPAPTGSISTSVFGR